MFSQNCRDVKMRFSKRKLHFLFLSFLCWRQRNRKKKKTKWKKTKQTRKNSVFSKVVIQKWEIKKMEFFFAKIAWHYLCQEGRKTCIFVHTICFGQNFFGPKQWKPGTTIKIVVSAEIVKNLKWHLFFEKGVFWQGWKLGFTNCVFEKLCLFLFIWLWKV